jgi:hypothetical protein
MYSHFNHVQSTTNPTKVIKQYGLFQFEEDANATPWNVSSPLDLAQPPLLFQSLKIIFLNFLVMELFQINEHLVSFSNACHNIGENENDTCMRLFVNSLEGKVVVDFFELPPKIFTTWDELSYWFKSTYGQPQSPVDLLKYYNNIVYNKGETIKSF